ncbi:hypothetical protein C8T65DRAFT_704082 [Cerioporus squamosus]|nr:hypothetical protein C8T65DRAFT_704082 [Cerioporus squamosus]
MVATAPRRLRFCTPSGEPVRSSLHTALLCSHPERPPERSYKTEEARIRGSVRTLLDSSLDPGDKAGTSVGFLCIQHICNHGDRCSIGGDSPSSPAQYAASCGDKCLYHLSYWPDPGDKAGTIGGKDDIYAAGWCVAIDLGFLVVLVSPDNNNYLLIWREYKLAQMRKDGLLAPSFGRFFNR